MTVAMAATADSSERELAGMVKRKRAQRGLSKIEAIVGVITLVVVVASLFMLKGKFVFDEPDTDAVVDSAADSTRQGASSSTASTTDLPLEAPKAGEIYFSAGSARLPVAAESSLAPLVSALRSDGSLTAMVVAEPTVADPDLARARANAIQHAFEADGVSAARVIVEIAPAHAVRSGASAGLGELRSVKPGAAASGVVRIELRAR